MLQGWTSLFRGKCFVSDSFDVVRMWDEKVLELRFFSFIFVFCCMMLGISSGCVIEIFEFPKLEYEFGILIFCILSCIFVFCILCAAGVGQCMCVGESGPGCPARELPLTSNHHSLGSPLHS